MGFLVFFSGSKYVGDWWLAYWISNTQAKDDTKVYSLYRLLDSSFGSVSSEVRYYLTVYGIIAASNSVSIRLYYPKKYFIIIYLHNLNNYYYNVLNWYIFHFKLMTFLMRKVGSTSIRISFEVGPNLSGGNFLGESLRG